MELRVLNYFLATAQELNMTRAAEKLLVSQPALSRQIADLEDELGVKLFERKPRHLVLTPAGQYLQEQAQEILTLSEKTKENLRSSALIAGDLTIGAGESIGMQRIMNVVSDIIKDYPNVKIHLFSGDYTVTERRLNHGTLDFAVIMGDLPMTNYESLKLPEADTWGVLLAADDPLKDKDFVQPQDLIGRPLLNSAQAQKRNTFQSWFGNYFKDINFIGDYNLNYNATLMVKNHAASMITFDHLADTSPDSGLIFKPFKPAMTSPINVIWKHETALSPVAQLFIERLRASIADQ